MIAFAARINHDSGPGVARDSLENVCELLERPCLEQLTRLAAFRGDRKADYQEKSRDALREYFIDPRNDAVIIDSGRQGPLEAYAHIETGSATLQLKRRWPAQLLSYFVVPLRPPLVTDLVAAACDLAVLLNAVTGAVSAEPSYDTAHSFAASMNGYAANDPAGEQHKRERASFHAHYSELDAVIPAPEWGLFLSAGHLRKLPIDAIRSSGAFSAVRELRPGSLVYVQLTDQLSDALSPRAPERIASARTALRDILMNS